jgi:hypothetical protein
MSTPLDGDPGRFEEGVGSFPKCGGSLFALVVEELAVGQSGMIIDGVVDVLVAGSGSSMPLPDPTDQYLVPDVGDPAESLNVDVDQIAGSVMDVGVDPGSAGLDPGPGARIGEGQQRAAVSAPDLVHGGNLLQKAVGDPGWPQRRETHTPTTPRSTRVGVRRGDDDDREERSSIPLVPWSPSA